MKELERSLRRRFPADEAGPLLEPFEEPGRDREFWNRTLDGLAVLGAPGLFEVYRLPRPVPELAVVAEKFHTKALRRFLQSTDRFQVLGLNRHAIRLFEGSRDALVELEPAPGVPRTIEEALGEELTEPHQTVASYGGTGAGSGPMHHGHGGKKDETGVDAERFFRAVDRAILEGHSRPSNLPLLLAALPEHHALFREVSHNPFLLAEGIRFDPGALSTDELRGQAWQIFEPHYRAGLMALAGDFAVAKSKGLGLDDLSKIAEAAFAGRIATLLIEADREIAGRIHAGSGHVHLGGSGHPEEDGLLDDLGELVVKQGGRVVVVPSEKMPVETGAAATCRF